MSGMEHLFRESLTGVNPQEEKLTPRFEFDKLVTFAGNKKTPIYNWFYYKEGFSRDFVWSALEELAIPKGSLVLDPFCGTGTTLLAAKQAGYDSVGFDILPLGVFVSKVKLAEGYDLDEMEKQIRHIRSLKFGEPENKLVDIRFLDMRKVYSRYARRDIPFFMEEIFKVEDEKIRDFMLLALISIVGQASNVKKDGGVLRIVRKKHLPPVRYLFHNKLKRMFKDLKKAGPTPKVSCNVNVGDARNIDLKNNSVDALITSPPYLNFVDYTKLYALELSLLVSSAREMESLRRMSMRSHVTTEYDNSGVGWDGLKPLLSQVLKANPGEDKVPLVVEGYVKDLYTSISEASRVIKPGGHAVYVVSNSALPGITVDIDIMVAEMGEGLGFTVEDIWVANVRWADVHGIVKARPVRESAVVLKRN
ncbi:MAG: DNA methyltransferase [Methanobacteriota archaeon]